MFLTSPNLAGIPHGFFTRKGGVSSGIYASLNCGGRDTGDNPSHVRENRARVAACFGTSESRLLSLYQVHGDMAVTVNTPWKHEDRPQADAMVTNKSGIALGILTADCVPVLFADIEHGVIGAVHAGWKGSLAGVIQQTLAAMRVLGARAESIRAGIGPCIGQASYEVGDDFYRIFQQRDKTTLQYFKTAEKPGHYLFGIRSYVKEILTQSGVVDVNLLENDTYIEEDNFFSYRRATHRKEPDYGRQISAIMLSL